MITYVKLQQHASMQSATYLHLKASLVRSKVDEVLKNSGCIVLSSIIGEDGNAGDIHSWAVPRSRFTY